MFHIGHTGKHGKYTFWRTGIAESPGSNTPLWGMTLQFGSQILGQISQTASQQGFHNHSRDASFLQFGIEITGIDIVLAYLVSIVPIKIVQFYLHKVPMVLLMQGNHLVEHFLLSVEREAEVADAA